MEILLEFRKYTHKRLLKVVQNSQASVNEMSFMFVCHTEIDGIKSSTQVKVRSDHSATCCLMHRKPSEGNTTAAANLPLEPLSL